MQEKFKQLHQKVHHAIGRMEIRLRAMQIYSKPLFLAFTIIAWIFSTLAAGLLLDFVLPKLEAGWFVKLILYLLAAFIFILIFVAAIGRKKRRGFLFWYPWSMVFILLTEIIFLQARQNYTEKQFLQILAATNSFFITSNSFSLWIIQEQKEKASDLQKQFDDYKRDSLAEKSDLKMDVYEANRQRDDAKQELIFLEANPDKLNQVYSNIFARTPTSFEQLDSAIGQFNGAISNLAEIENVTKQLEQNVNQSQYSSNQLSDLGIEKLPDGRTKFGGVITGSPKVIMEAMVAGYKSAKNQDFNAALTNYQRAIAAFESTEPSGVMIDTSSNLTAAGKAMMYGNAGEFAMRVSSNDLAIEYLKKSVDYAKQAAKENPELRIKLMATASLGDLGQIYLKDKDFTNSFEFFNAAITNYESINFSTNLIEEANLETNLLSLYGTAAYAAFRSGKTDEEIRFDNNAVVIFRKLKGIPPPSIK